MNHQPLVVVVVLNWNNYQDTASCILSIRRCGYPKLHVIVVDNASADDSLERLRKDFRECEFLQNSENLGYARGCNVGMRRALETAECRHVLLFANDAELSPAGLSVAVDVSEKNPSVGMVTGKILKSSESRLIWFAGGAINKWLGRSTARGYGEIDNGQYDTECDTEFATAALLLIKREVLEKVGLLPEEYFFGQEEWDFSCAVRDAGYRLRYVPALVACHAGDGSHWNYDPKFVYNYYRNKLIFQEKYAKPFVFPFLKILLSLYGLLVFDLKQKRMTRAFSPDRPVDIEHMKFALQCALRDHGKTKLDERQLLKFQQELQRRFPPTNDALAS